MESGPVPSDAPSVTDIGETFHVYGVRRDGDKLLYFGEPLVDVDEVETTIWPVFREAGYEVSLNRPSKNEADVGHVLVAEPVEVGINGIPWTNLVLFIATVFSTLYVGAVWYHVDLSENFLHVIYGWPFALGVLAVLGVHELGHYILSRRYGVQATLPYFIPVPTIFGTMGALIKINGRIPSRKALFDIGVAGPIAGILATVVVTVIGLHLPPVDVPQSVLESEAAVELSIGYPLLLEGLAWLVDQPLRYDDPATSVNPVVIAGWLGMFVTFLNLIPVGQLDGGHVMRALIGRRQRILGVFVPPLLVAMAAVLYGIFETPFHAVAVWLVWGLFGTLLAVAGPAEPVDDDRLGVDRYLLGIAILIIGALCFVPVPIEIVAS